MKLKYILFILICISTVMANQNKLPIQIEIPLSQSNVKNSAIGCIYIEGNFAKEISISDYKNGTTSLELTSQQSINILEITIFTQSDSISKIQMDSYNFEISSNTLTNKKKSNFEYLNPLITRRFNELRQIRIAIENNNSRWNAGLTSVFMLEDEDRFHLLSQEPLEQSSEARSGFAPRELEYPDSLDWRNIDGVNWLTDVRNQGVCGGCWAFAPVAQLEAVINIYESNPTIDRDLSEDILISDCCVDCGNCSGGYKSRAYDFMVDYGIPPEVCDPYTVFSTSCNSCDDWEMMAVGMSSWDWISFTSIDVEAIRTNLVDQPLATSMYSTAAFHAYTGGIYEELGTIPSATNHSVLIVGYNSVDDYFIVKNNWGDSWGEDGYFRIKTGDSNLGIWTGKINYSPLYVNAGADTTIYPAGFAELNPTVTGGCPNRTSLEDEGYVYHWSPSTGLSDPNIRNPIASPTTTTTYTLEVYDLNVYRTDEITVSIGTFPTTINDSIFCSKPCKPGIPVLLEAELLMNNPPEYSPLPERDLIFEIYYSGSWHVIPDDSLAETSLTTDETGYTSIYYTPLLPEGTYPIRARYSGDSDFSSTNIEQTLTVRKPNWSFLFYISADNSSDILACEKLYEEIATHGDNPDLSISVLIDRANDAVAYGGWSETRLYTVCETNLLYKSLGEQNLGNPSILINYIDLVSNIRSDNRALIFIAPGSGWFYETMDIPFYDHSIGHVSAFSIDSHFEIAHDLDFMSVGRDSTNEDELTLNELKSALDSTDVFDIIGFDSDFMSMTEILYELQNRTNILIASEDTVQSTGWEYTNFLNSIDSTTTELELAENITTDESQITLAAWYMTDETMNNLLQVINDFSNAIISLLPGISPEIETALGNSHRYSPLHDGNQSTVDLFNFAREMKNSTADSDLIEAGNNLMTYLENETFRIAWNSTYADSDSTGGVSIYFPEDTSDVNYSDYFNPELLRFPNISDSKWDDLLNNYFNPSDIVLLRGITINPDSIAPSYTSDNVEFDFAVINRSTTDAYIQALRVMCNTPSGTVYVPHINGVPGDSIGESEYIPFSETGRFNNVGLHNVYAQIKQGDRWYNVNSVFDSTNNPSHFTVYNNPTSIDITQTSVDYQSNDGLIQHFISARRSDNTPIEMLNAVNFDLSLGTHPLYYLSEHDFQLNQNLSCMTKNVCFCLDVSGSMSNDSTHRYANGEPAPDELILNFRDSAPFTAVLEGMDSIIAQKNPLDEYAICSFSNNAATAVDFTYNSSLLNDAIDGLFANGITALYDGISNAIEITSVKTKPRYIIVITDGNDSSSEADFSNVVEQASENDIPIYVVSISPSSLDTLNELSRLSGGVCIEANSSEEIFDALEKIMDIISSQYVLSYRFEDIPEEPTRRKGRVTCNYMGYSSIDSAYYYTRAFVEPRLHETTVNYMTDGVLPSFPTTVSMYYSGSESPEIKLYYKSSIDDTYRTPITLSRISDSLYSAVIPGFYVVFPGIDFYFSISEDSGNKKFPYECPENQPYTIPVQGNRAPKIDHAPITECRESENLPVTCTCSDSTDAVNLVELCYRSSAHTVFSCTELSVSVGDSVSGQYNGIIPSGITENNGWQYYLKAIDNYSIVNNTDIFEPFTNDLDVNLEINSITTNLAASYSPYNYEGEVGTSYTTNISITNNGPDNITNLDLWIHNVSSCGNSSERIHIDSFDDGETLNFTRNRNLPVCPNYDSLIIDFGERVSGINDPAISSISGSPVCLMRVTHPNLMRIVDFSVDTITAPSCTLITLNQQFNLRALIVNDSPHEIQDIHISIDDSSYAGRGIVNTIFEPDQIISSLAPYDSVYAEFTLLADSINHGEESGYDFLAFITDFYGTNSSTLSPIETYMEDYLEFFNIKQLPEIAIDSVNYSAEWLNALDTFVVKIFYNISGGDYTSAYFIASEHFPACIELFDSETLLRGISGVCIDDLGENLHPGEHSSLTFRLVNQGCSTPEVPSVRLELKLPYKDPNLPR